MKKRHRAGRVEIIISLWKESSRGGSKWTHGGEGKESVIQKTRLKELRGLQGGEMRCVRRGVNVYAGKSN